METLSRGYRNCNPGNIRLGASRFLGEYCDSEDPEFRQFEAMEWGYRAMFLVIHNYGELYGIHSLRGIISRWAPSHENDTANYAAVVARRLGIPVGGYINTLSRDVMCAMVAAMSWIENGVKAEMRDVEAGWELFFEGRAEKS